MNARERELSGNERVGYTCRVAVLAWILDQSADRVADQTEHVHQHGGGRVKTLLRLAAHQLDSRAGRHCGCDADLSLTAADRACNGCVAHGKVADRTGVEQGVDQPFIRDVVAVLQGKQHARQNTGAACGRRCDNQAHRSIYLKYCHRVLRRFVQHIPADGVAFGRVLRQFFCLAANQAAHGLDRRFERCQRG